VVSTAIGPPQRAVGKELLREVWFDEQIDIGDEWNARISDKLDKADIVVLLVSPDFIDSVFCALEVERAMKRHDEGSCDVFPIMLRHCNVSGAAFASLNAHPDFDRPIDSRSWPDKDLALRSLVNEIEKTLRRRIGAGPKYRLLHPHRDELTLLLHHLCDRSPQVDALNASFCSNRNTTRRPFVIVMQGRQHDSLEWFLNRLENVVLPRYVGQKPGRLSPLKWPEYSPGKSAFEMFASRLADCLPVPPFATIKEMNQALNQMSPVSLLPTSMPSRPWQEADKQMFECFLNLWEDWPRPPRDRLLIPVLDIQYPEDEVGATAIADYLQQVDFVARPSVGGVILPPMSVIEHHHFRDWLGELRVRAQLSSPERAVETSNRFKDVFPSRMYPLAEVHLPRFLESI